MRPNFSRFLNLKHLLTITFIGIERFLFKKNVMSPYWLIIDDKFQEFLYPSFFRFNSFSA